MGKQNLPENYHRDWQRSRAAHDPNWYEERKTARGTARRGKKLRWIEKFGGVCKDCSGRFHPAAFDFHHLDENDKDPRLGGYTNRVFMLSDKRITEELAKCVMLCSNCHRTRHANLNTSFKSVQEKRRYGK